MTEVDSGRLISAIKKIDAAYNRIMTDAAESCGLSRPEADVLIFFHNNPSFDTAQQFSELRGFSKSYTSKAIEQLMQKGLIWQKEDGTDRRFKHIVINESATAQTSCLRRAQCEFIELVSSYMSPEESAAVISAIDKLANSPLR